MTRLSLSLRPDSYPRLHTAMCRATMLELAVLALLAFARPLRAQRVQRIVLDEVSHQPLQAADVALLGAKGNIAGAALTGADGRFELEIPKLGAYSVKVKAEG